MISLRRIVLLLPIYTATGASCSPSRSAWRGPRATSTSRRAAALVVTTLAQQAGPMLASFHQQQAAASALHPHPIPRGRQEYRAAVQVAIVVAEWTAFQMLYQALLVRPAAPRPPLSPPLLPADRRRRPPAAARLMSNAPPAARLQVLRFYRETLSRQLRVFVAAPLTFLAGALRVVLRSAHPPSKARLLPR